MEKNCGGPFAYYGLFYIESGLLCLINTMQNKYLLQNSYKYVLK